MVTSNLYNPLTTAGQVRLARLLGSLAQKCRDTALKAEATAAITLLNDTALNRIATRTLNRPQPRQRGYVVRMDNADAVYVLGAATVAQMLKKTVQTIYNGVGTARNGWKIYATVNQQGQPAYNEVRLACALENEFATVNHTAWKAAQGSDGESDNKVKEPFTGKHRGKFSPNGR